MFNFNIMEIGLLSAVALVAINFYALNRKVKYINNVLKKICVKLGIELFDNE